MIQRGLELSALIACADSHLLTECEDRYVVSDMDRYLAIGPIIIV